MQFREIKTLDLEYHLIQHASNHRPQFCPRQREWQKHREQGRECIVVPLWRPCKNERVAARIRTHLHEEHVSGIVGAPVNRERLFLHQTTSERLQVDVVPVLHAHITTRSQWPTYANEEQEGLAVASIARDVVVEMTPPCDDNAR